METLFVPMSVTFERGKDRKRRVTFAGNERATTLEITKREEQWLIDMLNGNPGNEVAVWTAFQAIRQGKAEITRHADGSISIRLTADVEG